MAEKKIVKASDLKKGSSSKKTTSSKSKINLSKIKNLLDENPEAVNKIKEGVTDLITGKVTEKLTGKKTTKKKTTTKKTTKSDSDGLSKVIDLAGTLFKK